MVMSGAVWLQIGLLIGQNNIEKQYFYRRFAGYKQLNLRICGLLTHLWNTTTT